MTKGLKRWEAGWLVGLLLALALGGLPARADVLLTQITDTVRGADGVAAQGSVQISWPAFTTAGGQSVAKGSASVTLGSGGAFHVSLAPSAGANPIGTYYTVVYHLSSGLVTREYWVVPVSASPVTIAAVRASVLPTSVAMQTVSKQYVDQAIARALDAVPNSDPSNPYVEKVGDTMTGPLILSGDPTTGQQAATKDYVDAGDAALQAGLGQKVSTVPPGNQTVTQPVNTKLTVNRLNGVLDVGQFETGSNADGLLNTVNQADCASGCEALIERTYPAGDRPGAFAPSTTHFQDHRGGMQWDFFVNPHNPVEAGQDVGERVTTVHTEATADAVARSHGSIPFAFGMWVDQRGLAGGNNIFPEQITSSTPYFKTTYTALNVVGSYNTAGQHILQNQTTHCYAVGDCLLGNKLLSGTGGFRDSADEGIHPYDFTVQEDPSVFQGVCAGGCSTGSTQLTVSATRDAGTQGDGRFVIDTAPSKVLSTGSLVSGNANAVPFPTATFTGTNFPASTLFEIAAKVLPRADNIAPGTVTVAILTSGAPAGYSTNTLTLSATSGVACVVDATPGFASNPTNYEMANYQVVDGTHLQLTLNKPHDVNATISVGGLCGYGVEQVVDTAAGIRQVFPIVSALDATTIQYAAGHAAILGITGATGGYANVQLNITSIARSAGVVTLNVSGTDALNLDGLQMTVTGVADSSYNGVFTITQTGAHTFSYTQAGANSTSTGGTLGILTGSFKMYPMAEALSVVNPSTKEVDGTLVLAPNTVAWATGDPVEMPHYFLVRVASDVTLVTQQTPRPTLGIEAGIAYGTLLGPGAVGSRVSNRVPTASYFGYGGTHAFPSVGFSVDGIWDTTQFMTAGESTLIRVDCKFRGCGKWNSNYNVFSLQSNAGTDVVQYDPLTSTLTFGLRGAGYTMSPSGMTVGTLNATTINATAINGLPAATHLASGTVLLPSGAVSNALAASASIDTTNASNIVTGTLSASAGGTGTSAMPTAGQLLVGNAGGTGYGAVQVNGDATMSAGGTLSVTKTGGVAFGSAATQNTGTSGSAIAKLDGNNTWSGSQTFGNVAMSNPSFNGPLYLLGTPVAYLDANNLHPWSDGGYGMGTNGNMWSAMWAKTLKSGSNGTQFTVGSNGAVATAVEAVASTSSPTFDMSYTNHRMVLTANVTASTIAAGADGQQACFNLVQDATGGRTFVWPANVLGGMAVGTTAGKRSQQCFRYYAADSAWVAESAGMLNQ